MKALEFSTEVNATPEKVWKTLWENDSYTIWSSGNRFEGNWEQGSTMKFLDPKNNGMYNEVEINNPEKELKMKHIGWIFDGELSPQGWEDSNISYQLEPNENSTKLNVKINALDEFVDFYNDYIPKISAKIKELSETN